MTRTEENKELVDRMVEQAQGKEGEFENLLLFQLGVSATFLGDISKSLAIIAEHYEEMTAEKEAQENEALGMAILEHERKRMEDDGK